MDLNLIKKLIRLIEGSTLAEMEIEEENFKIKLSKKFDSPHVISHHAPIAHLSPPPIPNQQSEVSLEQKKEKTESVKENFHEIKSPIVGTLYRAPAPDADPFVRVGDIVSVGTVLCIVEAMKLMNEIESDVSGKIVKILVENGQPVEYNQPLFLVEIA